MKTTLFVLLATLFTFTAAEASEHSYVGLKTRFARASAPMLTIEELKGYYPGTCYGVRSSRHKYAALLFIEDAGTRRKLTKLGLAFQYDQSSSLQWSRIRAFVSKYVNDSFLSDAFVANNMLTSEYSDKGSYDLREDSVGYVARVFLFASNSAFIYCQFDKAKIRAPGEVR